MTFVNESISEGDQECIDYSALRDPQNGGRIPCLPRWTIDRERNAFLLRIGGGMSREDYHVPFYFLFSWESIWMRVDAFLSEEWSSGLVTFKLIRFHIPKNLPWSLDEIERVLALSFTAHGSHSYEPTHPIRVHVDFSQMQCCEFKVENVADKKLLSKTHGL